jgi:GxxExxY protein
VDLICFGTLLVELKAIRAIGGSELAQTLNYLKASRLPKGLLINFGASSLEFRRVILSASRSSSA